MCGIWECLFGRRKEPEVSYEPPHYDNPVLTQPTYQSFGREPTRGGLTAPRDFQEQLRKRVQTARQQQTHVDDYDSSSPDGTIPTPVPTGYEEPHVNLELERQQQEFEENLNRTKRLNQENEKRQRVEKMENDRRADLEFQEARDRQKREHEESYRRMKEENEEFDRETERLLQERIAEWRAHQEMLFQCVLLKQHLDAQQKEWANWLGTVSDSISTAKSRYELFQKIFGSLDRNETSYQKIVNEELVALHKSTLSAYDMVHESWRTIKELSEKLPDRVFLKILMKDLSNISYVGELNNSFGALNNRDIPSTRQLSEQSKTARSEDFLILEEPLIYRKSSVGIVEIREETTF
ncbi:hypothetical protein CAEBREN_01131 [Caenorhabditis brenneri]|uniref:Uncharacterized protein n=1 Tax=Caenorhabditis brenneri TaxID=135651 RepID=G0NWD8_CAEBE|nr:hypothetical protein CAEBREN_01131 [Caenorhabditis brenneri]